MFSSRTNWRLEPNRFSQVLDRHRRSGKPLYDLTASNPTTCGFAYPEREILAALADPRALRYAPESKGLLDARAAVAGYYRGRSGFAGPAPSGGREPVDPERIVLTSGTSEAYSYILRLLCDVGDEILVPAPSYPLFEFLAGLADLRLVPYQLVYHGAGSATARNPDHGWQVDLRALRAAITPRSRAVLVVHPNNPTGSFVKPHEAAELTAICAERGMAIVADEVFLDYAAGSAAPASFAFHRDALTFTLSGLSKTCALPQMKLAWLVVSGPDALVRTAMDRLDVIADTYLSPGTPVQLAAAKLLAVRGGMQEQLQRRIASNLAYLDGVLGGSGSTNALVRLDREGGWYAVLRVPRLLPDEGVGVGVLERCSVLVHPGHFFDFAEEGFLVVSLIPAEDEFREGMRRLQNFFAG